MWIESSDTLIHALGYNTTLFAGQSEGSYVLIFVPKKLEDLETFNAVLKRGAGDGWWYTQTVVMMMRRTIDIMGRW